MNVLEEIRKLVLEEIVEIAALLQDLASIKDKHDHLKVTGSNVRTV